jgi:hypothetical protein
MLDKMGVINYLRYYTVDYDEILREELKKPYAAKLDGYDVASFDDLNGVLLH